MSELPTLTNLERQPGFRWASKPEVRREGDSVALQRIGACSASLRELIDDGKTIFDEGHLLTLCKALGQLIDSDLSLDQHIENLEHDARRMTTQDVRDWWADLDAKSDRECL